MHRRFAVVTALLAGAFAAIAALPLVSACQRRASDTSFLATDAQAAAANPTTTADTVKQASELFARLNKPNVMIKIPATSQCLPAIADTIAAGINVNVTLISRTTPPTRSSRPPSSSRG